VAAVVSINEQHFNVKIFIKIWESSVKDSKKSQNADGLKGSGKLTRNY
jgi:hypothetical protein